MQKKKMTRETQHMKILNTNIETRVLLSKG